MWNVSIVELVKLLQSEIVCCWLTKDDSQVEPLLFPQLDSWACEPWPCETRRLILFKGPRGYAAPKGLAPKF